jgi:dethiobiotin synthetase
MKPPPHTIFIAGIDTGVGKTVACGMLARYLLEQGESVITQKLVQTGARGARSPDIALHRRLMGVRPTPEDRAGLTCPYVFRYPASPHLAAALEGRRIGESRITTATRRLASVYDRVLIEGVGGVDVPLRNGFTCLDYLASMKYPVVVVSSSRLGSINHTLLTLRALNSRRLRVTGIVYNRRWNENKVIAGDTRNVLLRALADFGYPAALVDLPFVRDFNKPPRVDFSALIKTTDP